jgi:hypothetical protein
MRQVRPQWAAAVAVAGEHPPADLAAAVAEELVALWSDLGEAMRRAGTRSWSAECDGLTVRIVMLTRLTAATSWPWIPAPLLASGVYQGILQSAGVAFTAPCPAEIPGVSPAPDAGTAELPGTTGPGTLARPGTRDRLGAAETLEQQGLGENGALELRQV